MPATRQLSITLPADMADMVHAKVASGDYASESEVVCEGLLALADRDRSLEDWLRTEAAAAYDEILADPSRGRSADEVLATLAADEAEETDAH